MIALIIALCIFSFEVGTVAGIFIYKRIVSGPLQLAGKQAKKDGQKDGQTNDFQNGNSSKQRDEKNYLDDLNFLFNFNGKQVKEDE